MRVFILLVFLLLVIFLKRSNYSNSVAVISSCGNIDDVLELCKEFSLEPIIYEKCSDCKVPMGVFCKPRKNVGREQETFLHFVVTHYDDLPNEIVFIAAPLSKHDRLERLRSILKDDVIGCQGDIDDQGDFFLDSHMGSEVEPASVRPFKNWHNEFIKPWDQREKSACWNGVMKTTRERILSKPKTFYETLLSQVNSHNSPEAGHYMERSMGSIF